MCLASANPQSIKACKINNKSKIEQIKFWFTAVNKKLFAQQWEILMLGNISS